MYFETVKLIMNQEAEVDKSASINMVLNLASRNGHQGVLKLFLEMRVVKLFLDTSTSRTAAGPGFSYAAHGTTPFWPKQKRWRVIELQLWIKCIYYCLRL